MSLHEEIIAFHRSSYEDTRLPEEARLVSKQWLEMLGYGGVFGQLLPDGELPNES